ncbi:uncharacterized protein BO66DRAFT_56175 [Aspergillus aculeatinus CBS 121060]|uniref:Uncharacterized protein n=1 Tax=Aspergillus aculeatinus CBS 121060 TaxID=1448322 RepID=A0ACD1HD80_9EURO|nr:hypothetical protein BO66DRAFT_56175 [Aspergillus aculeatinus CBS 121060]RAH71351.1 hypothetical protein BO66DRAFT_56175 [Aspergillus aculeatinus CBS 121060]
MSMLYFRTQSSYTLFASCGRIFRERQDEVSAAGKQSLVGDIGRSNLRSHKKPNISPPQEFWARIPSWIKDPKLFFDEQGLMLSLEVSPIAGIYQYLDGLGLRGKVDIIRARLVKIVFHRLKERLGLRYIRSDNIDYLVKIISNSGFSDFDPSDIRPKIVR